LHPEDANVLIEAFEETLKALQLVNRDDPATMLVAERIIEVAKRGERDPQRLRSPFSRASTQWPTKSLSCRHSAVRRSDGPVNLP
jgi:hypothetical protein